MFTRAHVGAGSCRHSANRYMPHRFGIILFLLACLGATLPPFPPLSPQDDSWYLLGSLCWIMSSPKPSADAPRSGSSSRHSSDHDFDARSGSETLGEEVTRLGSQGTGQDKQITVAWEGDDDPACPLNWSSHRKWVATSISEPQRSMSNIGITLLTQRHAASAFTFISPVSSSMVAPAVAQLGQDLHIHSTALLGMAVSIFVAAYAVGPLFFGPASEVFGRVRIIQTGNFLFCAFNLGCGFAQTTTQFMILRFLAGIGGSPPLAVGGALLSDMWRPHERGKAIAVSHQPHFSSTDHG